MDDSIDLSLTDVYNKYLNICNMFLQKWNSLQMWKSANKHFYEW
jgi:hypothetical protein